MISSQITVSKQSPQKFLQQERTGPLGEEGEGGREGGREGGTEGRKEREMGRAGGRERREGGRETEL